VTRRAPRAALRPCRATAASARTLSRGRPSGLSAATSQRYRTHCTMAAILPAIRVLSRTKITLKGELRASLRDSLREPLTVILSGSIGAYRKDGQAWTLANAGRRWPSPIRLPG
jgi:hypothetical protein